MSNVKNVKCQLCQMSIMSNVYQIVKMSIKFSTCQSNCQHINQIVNMSIKLSKRQSNCQMINCHNIKCQVLSKCVDFQYFSLKPSLRIFFLAASLITINCKKKIRTAGTRAWRWPLCFLPNGMEVGGGPPLHASTSKKHASITENSTKGFHISNTGVLPKTLLCIWLIFSIFYS